jgi:hypothetical protein
MKVDRNLIKAAILVINPKILIFNRLCINNYLQLFNKEVKRVHCALNAN